MSGFWSIDNVANRESLWVDAEPAQSGLVPSRVLPNGRTQWLDPVTAALLFTLPFVDVEEITRENLEEAFVRTRMLELARGPILILDSGEARYVTFGDIQSRVGLRVGAGMALRPFDEIVLDQLRRRAREALEEAQKAH